MTIGASIFLIALGAILKYAVDVTVSGIEIQTIGLILMIAGIVGLVIGLFLLTQADRRRPSCTTTAIRSRPGRPLAGLLLGCRADDPVVAEAADVG